MRLGGIAVSLGGVVAVGIIGAGIGYVAGRPAENAGAATITFQNPSPMPARPSVPIDPPPTYAPDPPYPALAADLDYTAHTFRAGRYVWHYDAPTGWVGQHSLGPNDTPQVTWRPPGQVQPGAPAGGYQLRIAPVGGHSTPGQMISARWTGLQESQAAGSLTELTQLNTNSYAAWYTFRDGSGHFRLNDFAWVTDPGPDGYVGFELSVAGRAADQEGLDALLQHVYNSAYRTTSPKKGAASLASGKTPGSGASGSATDSPGHGGSGTPSASGSTPGPGASATP